MADRSLDDGISVEEIREYAECYRNDFEGNPNNKLLIDMLDQIQFTGENTLDFYGGLMAGLGFQRETEDHIYTDAGQFLGPVFDVIRCYYANKIEELGLLEKSVG